MSLHNVIELNGLNDPLKQYQFRFVISDMVNSVYDPRKFEMQCSSFTFPGAEIKTTNVVIGTHYRTRACLQDKSGIWTTRVYDVQGGEVLLSLQSWLDAINNPLTGLISPSARYVREAEIQILDSKMNVTQKIYMYGVFPIRIGQLQIESSSSEAVSISVDWNYDWFTTTNVGLTHNGGLASVATGLNPLSWFK